MGYHVGNCIANPTLRNNIVNGDTSQSVTSSITTDVNEPSICLHVNSSLRHIVVA